MGTESSNLRLASVFLLGIAVGICLMLVYVTVRGQSVAHPPQHDRSAEAEQGP